MKKIFTLIIIAVTLVSCGSSAGVSSNATIGNLPSLFADWNLETDNLKAKLKKASSLDEITKLSLQREDIKANYNNLINAEIAALIGKEIKFTMSQDLKNSSDIMYSITSAPKIAEGATINAAFTPVANQDIEVTSDNQYEHSVYGKMVNGMGEPIYAFKTTLLGSLGGKTIAKGGPLFEFLIPFKGLGSIPELWADFDQIVFCTKEEYEKADTDADAAIYKLRESSSKK